VDEDTLRDGDGDGYGVGLCPTGLLDCDDTDPTIHPGATEDRGEVPCVDRDCDGACEEDPLLQDDDGDGYCESGPAIAGTSFCDGSPGPADCDDADPTAFPRDPSFDLDLSDGVDNDCDGGVDEDAGLVDLDRDGSSTRDDCDDGRADVFPGAIERCDGVDDDCDGVLLPTEVDLDGPPGQRQRRTDRTTRATLQPMPREAGDAAGPWRRPLSYLSPARAWDPSRLRRSAPRPAARAPRTSPPGP
jgi:hypothetical protein